MKVVHIDTELTWRGGEQQMFYLARGLQGAGCECLLVCQPDGAAAARAKTEGLPIAPVTMRGEADVFAAAKIAAMARRGFNILHAHTSHAHTLAVLAKWMLRKPCRVVVHRRVDFSIHKLPFKLSLLKYRIGVDRYIAVAEAVKRVMVRDGVPADKIDVVRSCTDLRRFDQVEPADLRSEFGLPRDAVIVGNVGFLVGHKDHANLVRAAAIVRQTHPEARFVVAGEGELRPAIEELRDALGLHDHFILAGFRSDIPAVLAGFDIFALSSCMEGIAGTLFEAMAMRRPIATTNAGGIGEYIHDGVNGLLVNTGDPQALASAIVRLIENADQARTLAKAARQTVVEHFSTERLVEQTLKVYERVLDKA